MRNKKTWILLMAILVVLVLAVCGCGKKKEDVTPATTEAKQETQTETKDETKAETKEEATEPDQGAEVVPSDAECMQIAMTLLNTLQYVTKVGAGAIATDRDTVYKYGDFDYYRVTEPGIDSFNDIFLMLNYNFTLGCIEDRWKFMTDPGDSAPFMIYVQDEGYPEGMYLINAGTGYFDYTPTGNIQIEHVDENHFHAIVPFNAYNHDLTLDMDIIKEDYWKINGFIVNE